MVPGKKVSGLELREKENHGLSVSDKINNFDLFCTSDTGEQFIVEMQFSHQDNYSDRMLCYATYPIHSGRNGELMTGALQFIYLELGRLKVSRDEPEKCRTLLEKFAFSLKYMHELPERPEGFGEDILKMLYDAAEFANMTVERQTEYEIVMRNELDIIAEKNYARRTALEEGRAEGMAKGEAKGRAESSREIAAKMIQEGITLDVVQRVTGLTSKEISE